LRTVRELFQKLLTDDAVLDVRRHVFALRAFELNVKQPV